MPRINTYSDNASIENDDKMLTYDTQAAATKLTAFSIVWNWIVSKLHALTSSGAALTPSTDRVLMDKNGTMTRVEPAAVAKYGIETYNGSTIAGSAQTVKSALDTLNSKTLPLYQARTDVTDANNFKTAGLARVSNNTTTNLPENGYYVLQVIPFGTDDVIQYAYNVNNTLVWHRSFHDGTTWTAWELVPTRSEITALNSNQTRQTGTLTPASNITLIQNEYSSTLYKVGKVCTISCSFYTTSNFTSNIWSKIFDLPSGFRPSEPMPISVSILGSGHAPGTVYDGKITSTGEVQLYTYQLTSIPGRAIIQSTFAIY